jgi:hypothetical protein
VAKAAMRSLVLRVTEMGAKSREKQSKQIAELARGQAGIPGDAAHGKSIDGIGAGNGKEPGSVGHHDVFALAEDGKPGCFQCFDRLEVVDPGDFGHFRPSRSLRGCRRYPRIGGLPGGIPRWHPGYCPVLPVRFFLGTNNPVKEGRRPKIPLLT